MSTNSQSDKKLKWRLRIRQKETGILTNTRYCWAWTFFWTTEWMVVLLEEAVRNPEGGKITVPFQTEPRGPTSLLYNGYGTSSQRMKRTGPVVDHPPSCSYNSTTDFLLHGTFKATLLLQKGGIFVTSWWPVSFLRTSFRVVLFVSIFGSSCKYLEHNNPIK